ncbi:MAG: glycosyltransferase family 2 protein [Candidatus Magasanikbacteria bacterium]
MFNNQNNKFKFTVITCTYNSEKYLQDCINSVENQDYKNFEHIFIDAFSTDHTVEIIKKYQLRHTESVRLIQEKPEGISRAMNTGIKYANGEILVHLHSDDYFFDDHVLSLVYKKFSNSSAMIVVGNCLYKKDDGFHSIWPKNKFVFWLFCKFIESYLFFRNGIPHPSTFIKKEVFERRGLFLENLKVVMDYELWFRLLKKEKFLFVKNFLSVYRAHGATVSGLQSERGKLEIAGIFKKYKKQYFLEFVFCFILLKPIINIRKVIKSWFPK